MADAPVPAFSTALPLFAHFHRFRRVVHLGCGGEGFVCRYLMFGGCYRENAASQPQAEHRRGGRDEAQDRDVQQAAVGRFGDDQATQVGAEADGQVLHRRVGV